MLLTQAVVTRVALSVPQHSLSEDAFLGDFHGWLTLFLSLFIVDFFFCFPRLVFLYHLVHTSQAINVVFHASRAPMPTEEILWPRTCISVWLSREVYLAERKTAFKIGKYDFSEEANVTWTTVKFKITCTFCKAHSICLMFGDLSLCRSTYNFLCDHSLKCILIYWLPDRFGLGWNCRSLWPALDHPFCFPCAVQVLLLRNA